ncbi:MAG: hypothetical protein IJ229_08095, partial [Clostridia bacterium]|nr:hypothetical protein [Clostridia bacterium]
ARSLLCSVMTGLMVPEHLTLFVIGADSMGQETLESLVGDYRLVRAHLSGETQLFACDVTLVSLPEEEMDASLMEKCVTREDKLLLATLFSSERTLRRSVVSSMETAQTAWADLLRDPESKVRQVLGELDEETCVLLSASVVEPLGASGAGQLIGALRETGARTGAVLTLPMHTQERTDLAGSALREIDQIGTEGLDALYLFGLPTDARTPGEGIEELVLLRCMEHFLSGGSGMYSFSSALESPDWSFFGDRQEAYRAALLDMLHTAMLLMLRYGPEALERLSSPGALGMRGWFGRYFPDIRRHPEMGEEESRFLTSLLHLMRFHTAWCYLVTGSLPLPLRVQAQITETMESAGAFYDTLLEEAGRLTLLSHDLNASGITEEETVHRFSMADTEGEKARKRLAEQAAKVKGMAEEMEKYTEILGGRFTLILLEKKTEEAMAEAQQLKAQSDEAEKRIREAAEKASSEEMPKVDAARSRLNNLKRHLAFLQGKAAYATRDLTAARLEENRARAPKDALAQEPDVL